MRGHYRTKREVAENILIESTQACKAIEDFALAVLENNGHDCSIPQEVIDKLVRVLRYTAIDMYVEPVTPEDEHETHPGAA